MKKFIALLIIAAIACCSVVCFAKGFITSPTQQGTPDAAIENYDNSYPADIVVTAYKDKDSITDTDSRIQITEAYDAIANSENITTVMPVLTQILDSKNIKPEDTIIQNLFDVSVVGDISHYKNSDGEVTVVFKTEPLFDSFISLLCLVDGQWKEVPVVVSGTNNDTLTAKIKDFTTFAIVTRTSHINEEGEKESPKTGESFIGYIAAGVGGLLIVAGAAIAITTRKKSEN